MFKRQVQKIDGILQMILREQGLEIPLQQKRVIDQWEVVTGKIVGKYTAEKFIKNQTLYVKITNPALRQDLTMMRHQLVKRLNESVGALIIVDVKLY